MNVASLETLVSLLALGEKVYLQISALVAAEKSGTPLPLDQLQQMKADSDAAHTTIQSWSSPAHP